ncbi:MAG TPA: hypothetical protein VGK14_10095 [Novimethylophilus sp.]|jgi:hypothetical protein|uniref:esterase/lipase family protein n=1 Tax=Novimethylophilus sp. TaxID=2137426 RepID=UPI002F404EE1
MPNTVAPYYPIIYVRGYAMSQSEIDETTADPFCGFNLGSTVFRATPDRHKPARKFIFESPVIRLNSDFGYRDVFENGLDIMDPDWGGTIPTRSVIIYRYYEQASQLLGNGKTPSIETFAQGLGRLVQRVRDLVCTDPRNALQPDDFRCYLVAHSMGGLVCRAFLQNPALDTTGARKLVDKVFTYATPHNGIEMAGINVPGWISLDDMNNFNRERMADYLDLKERFGQTQRVDWLPEAAFPSSRFFCMIGSNRSDYEVAAGASRTFAGHGSDGLVKIANASVWGLDAQGNVSAPSATAYAYRSHSGYFGIVNNEESYQNLVRFLFGDLRVDCWVEVVQLSLPQAVQQAVDAGREADALYIFEILAAPRGKRWYLTRRTAEEDSAACLSLKDWLHLPANARHRSLYLSSIFLDTRWRVDMDRPSLAYSLTLGVRTPDYEVERRFLPDEHYEGGYLFHDTAAVELIPPQTAGDKWQVFYDWQSQNPGKAATPVEIRPLTDGRAEIRLPIYGKTTPGIDGYLRFVVSRWNQAL